MNETSWIILMVDANYAEVPSVVAVRKMMNLVTGAERFRWYSRPCKMSQH